MISIVSAAWRVGGVRAVLFDKDGTLIDSHAYWGRIIERRAGAIVRHHALGADAYPGLCLSMGFDLSVRRLRPEGPVALVSREEVIAAVLRHLASQGVSSSEAVLAGLFLREHEAFLPEMHDHIKILPGVRPLLNALRVSGVKTAVVTTDSVVNARETLRQLGIDGLFDAVVGKETVKEAKPTGVPAREALRLLGAGADEAACIGDAPMDLVMGRNAALRAGIGVASGQTAAAELRELSPYVVDSLEDLAIQRNA